MNLFLEQLKNGSVSNYRRMDDDQRSRYVESLLRDTPRPQRQPSSENDVDAVALKAFAASSVNVWGGGSDVEVTEWPESVTDEQREWCRAFAKAVLESRPAPQPLTKTGERPPLSGSDYMHLTKTRNVVREVANRIYSPTMTGELRRIHRELKDAESWLSERVTRLQGTNS